MKYKKVDYNLNHIFQISYSDYPVFEGAPLLSVVKVEADFEGNLHWPELQP